MPTYEWTSAPDSNTALHLQWKSKAFQGRAAAAMQEAHNSELWNLGLSDLHGALEDVKKKITCEKENKSNLFHLIHDS